MIRVQTLVQVWIRLWVQSRQSDPDMGLGSDPLHLGPDLILGQSPNSGVGRGQGQGWSPDPRLGVLIRIWVRSRHGL